MGRNTKEGLSYFPMDVDLFEDEKIQFVSARFGLKGEAIAVRLLCRIYRQGYFIEFDNDVALLFARSVGDISSHGLVNDVVNELLKRGFFDRSIFERFSILTSLGIQKRYIKICTDSKRKNISILSDFDLLNPNNLKTPEEKPFTREEIHINTVESTQSKVKESKEKKISNTVENGVSTPLKNAISNLLKPEKEEEKSSAKKEEEKPPAKKVTMFWKELVAAWFDFYQSRYEDKPTMNEVSAKSLKTIVSNLKRDSEGKGYTWDAAHAVTCLSKFLELAYTDNWNKNNFLLKNLASHYDAIKNYRNASFKNGRTATGGQVDTVSAFNKIDQMFGNDRTS